jgi:hypothetical protein
MREPRKTLAADFLYPEIEGTRSSETSVLTRPTWRHIPEDCILHLESFIMGCLTQVTFLHVVIFD